MKRAMIIKVDHLTYITENIQYDENILKSYGYNNEFYEKNLINPQNKYKFLKYEQLEYSMALYLKNQSYNIELISYPKTLINEFPLNKLRIKLKNDTKDINELSDLCNLQVQGVFNEYIVFVADFYESIKFWEMLGFKQIEIGCDYAKLIFNMWNGDKFYVILQWKKELSHSNTYLECLGFNNIAFISTSVEQEQKRFICNKLECTEIETISINGKRLKVFFVKGPSNEMVEIIGIVK